MGHYIKHKKNYWDRKVFNQDSKFDVEILSYKKLEKQLLLQYRKETGNVPIWNKGIQ